MKVELLGTNFTLESDEDPEYLETVTEYLSKKIEEIKSTVPTRDPIKLAILAGILVVDELYKTREGEDSTRPLPDLDEAERLTLALIEKLDSSLEENSLGSGSPSVNSGEPNTQ